MTDLQQLLADHITPVFDNEQAFVEHFFKVPKLVYELDGFYMASEQCIVLYHQTGGLGAATKVITFNELETWLSSLKDTCNKCGERLIKGLPHLKDENGDCLKGGYIVPASMFGEDKI